LTLLEPYRICFGELNCQLDVQIYWSDKAPGISLERLPFSSGYTCSISCLVRKNGEIVVLDEEEGYCAACNWTISSIRRWLWHLVVTLCENTDDIRELDTYLDFLTGTKSGTQQTLT
jgi:hypothetical protein